MKSVVRLSVILSLMVPAVVGAQQVSEPQKVYLTVYNGGFALVKDVRNISLQQGRNSLEVPDVAAQIDPTSVLFKPLTAPNSVTILEQNYQYDLISPENILNKSVGQRVTFTRFDSSGQPHTETGALLNPPSNGGTVIRTDDGRIVLNPSGTIAVENMPEGLHPRPTLNWLLDSSRAGAQEAEISYITNGIGWHAAYVALVNEDDSRLDLTGWVTLNNNSGAAYKDAVLMLMAGDVRRVQERMYAARAPAGDVANGYGGFEEKSFFEYHLYTMSRPTTIAQNETKQLALLNASNVPVTKEFIYDGRQQWWRNWWYPGRSGDPGGGYDTSDYHKVNVVLEVKNSNENNMGMPLPKGTLRVYKLDDTGSQQFIGEDEIDHTPRDEKIRLSVGDAFDVVGDYKRTDYGKISKNVMEESFEVVIRNHKDVPVEVKVVDHVWSDWEIVRASDAHNKIDAHTIRFPIKVAANGEKTVTYTIRTKW